MFLCLINHYAMKMYWGSGGIAQASLMSALDGGEWSASSPGRFTPGERTPGNLWVGGWLGPRGGLHVVPKRKILIIAPEGKGTPVVQLVSILTDLLQL
jgi:hypothetical protein